MDHQSTRPSRLCPSSGNDCPISGVTSPSGSSVCSPIVDGENGIQSPVFDGFEQESPTRDGEGIEREKGSVEFSCCENLALEMDSPDTPQPSDRASGKVPPSSVNSSSFISDHPHPLSPHDTAHITTPDIASGELLTGGQFELEAHNGSLSSESKILTNQQYINNSCSNSVLGNNTRDESDNHSRSGSPLSVEEMDNLDDLNGQFNEPLVEFTEVSCVVDSVGDTSYSSGSVTSYDLDSNQVLSDSNQQFTSEGERDIVKVCCGDGSDNPGKDCTDVPLPHEFSSSGKTTSFVPGIDCSVAGGEIPDIPPPSYATTVVTAVVESTGTGQVPESESMSAQVTDADILNSVVVHTSLLASGHDLPSLPPPTVVPIDDFGGQFLDVTDKADLCALEMKILQKSEPGNPIIAERCDSQLSTLSDKVDICRICHCEGEENNKLISPCLCSGSLKFLHLSCLQKWIKSSDKKACELCNFDYIMSSKTRPFKEWEKLEMSQNERRKVVCSVTFHVIAITCVIWSLYVLIDRTTEEVHLGTLDWPFWTKLIVVAIGFTGGMIFMYVQCKMYVQLCSRWRGYNKLITIENAPEDPQVRAEAAARIKDKAGEEGGIVNIVALQEIDAV